MGNDHGFITQFYTKDIGLIKNGSKLVVLKDDTIIANIRLDGMNAAVISLDKCIKSLGPDAFINEDPFAKP